jgi:tRNA A-37 threonylcarbamoyl transferase component Bud32
MKTKSSPIKPTSSTGSLTVKQRCDNGQRCKKGTRCNKKTGYCEKTQLKTRKASVKNTTKRSPSSLLRSKREKNSKLEMMRVNESYNELGITQTDYFEDVCLVLKNIRNKLHISNDPSDRTMEWSNEKIFQLHNLSPFITNKQGVAFKTKKVLDRDLYLGPHLIRATNIIGQGAYGKIYKGTFGDKNCAIKQSLQSMTRQSDVINYYTEIIIQNELFCQAHRQALSQPKYAKIPKPYFMARLHDSPLLGMEPLDNSLYNFITKSTKPSNLSEKQYQVKMTNIIIDMFECLSNTLIYLQDNYDFYHRDMHAGNIMYRKQGESYQWYLIDFGMSIFKLNNYHFNSQGAGVYGRYNTSSYNNGKGKVGHDLRLIIVFIYTTLSYDFNNMMLKDAFRILYTLYTDINNAIRTKHIGNYNDEFWHRCYGEAFDRLVTHETDPRIFLAETIPKLREVVAKEKGNSSIKKSSVNTGKEYYHVERKEGQLRTTN